MRSHALSLPVGPQPIQQPLLNASSLRHRSDETLKRTNQPVVAPCHSAGDPCQRRLVPKSLDDLRQILRILLDDAAGFVGARGRLPFFLAGAGGRWKLVVSWEWIFSVELGRLLIWIIIEL
ncbi:hypothetical protein BSZ22_02480 [Bradyrhizobium canariense]|uniref:Uncharacterized protein n=1 Tax=Bradyrhizobium canariense TaxID=255045 RepID=A0A1X3GTP8_9BRAD|nr:hypothetical protein BSZ22_02480 [Bradyrhizobium canariense]OSI82346.1 hypothetical protein BSZ23_01910 [Bradyrhizobium canariense]OSI96679.1 hypothetical protein BSZ25_01680 [Bradyrhizobium canariense]OSI98385.1 hypothetical protein BSZ24_01530 [Bradyrhizobium canariense]OSJ15809.1 hypothetical protein BSZ16_01625 [Bradyrhizobium canariense]